MSVFRQSLPVLVLTAGVLSGACLIHNMSTAQHIQDRTLSMSAVVETAPSQSMTDYDSRFLDDMRKYDQSVVTSAQVSVSKLKHPELRKLAQHIISAQQAEARQLQDWHKRWYGQ